MNFSVAFLMIFLLMVGEAFAGSFWSKPKSATTSNNSRNNSKTTGNGEASKSRIQSSNVKPKSEIRIKHRSRTQHVTTRKENGIHQRTITRNITELWNGGRHNQIVGQTVFSNSWKAGSSSNKSGTSAPVVERSRRVSIWRIWTWQ